VLEQEVFEVCRSEREMVTKG